MEQTGFPFVLTRGDLLSVMDRSRLSLNVRKCAEDNLTFVSLSFYAFILRLFRSCLSVKKGGGNGKWKVRLKDGILHMNGRDYLFSKANCDLDW